MQKARYRTGNRPVKYPRFDDVTHDLMMLKCQTWGCPGVSSTAWPDNKKIPSIYAVFSDHSFDLKCLLAAASTIPTSTEVV